MALQEVQLLISELSYGAILYQALHHVANFSDMEPIYPPLPGTKILQWPIPQPTPIHFLPHPTESTTPLRVIKSWRLIAPYILCLFSLTYAFAPTPSAKEAIPSRCRRRKNRLRKTVILDDYGTCVCISDIPQVSRTGSPRYKQAKTVQLYIPPSWPNSAWVMAISSFFSGVNLHSVPNQFQLRSILRRPYPAEFSQKVQESPVSNLEGPTSLELETELENERESLLERIRVEVLLFIRPPLWLLGLKR